MNIVENIWNNLSLHISTNLTYYKCVLSYVAVKAVDSLNQSTWLIFLLITVTPSIKNLYVTGPNFTHANSSPLSLTRRTKSEISYFIFNFTCLKLPFKWLLTSKNEMLDFVCSNFSCRTVQTNSTLFCLTLNNNCS